MGNNNQKSSQRGRSASPVPSKKNSAIHDIPKASLSPAPRKGSAKKSKLSIDVHPENLLGGADLKYPPGVTPSSLLKQKKLDFSSNPYKTVKEINQAVHFAELALFIAKTEKHYINAADPVLLGFNTDGVTERYPVQGSAVSRRISFNGSLNDFVDGYAGTIEKFDYFIKAADTFEIGESQKFRGDKNTLLNIHQRSKKPTNVSARAPQDTGREDESLNESENMKGQTFANSNLLKKLSKNMQNSKNGDQSDISHTNFLDGEDNRMFTRTGKIQVAAPNDYDKRTSGYFGGQLPAQALMNPDLISTEQTKTGKDASNISIESDRKSFRDSKKNLNEQLDHVIKPTDSQVQKKSAPVVSLTPRAETNKFIIFTPGETATPKEMFSNTNTFKGRKTNSNLQPNGARNMTVIIDSKPKDKTERITKDNNNSFMTVNDVSKGPVLNKKYGKNTQPNNVSRVPQKAFWKEAERPSTTNKKSSMRSDPKTHEQAKTEQSVNLLQKNLETHKYEKNLTQSSPQRKYFQPNTKQYAEENPIEEQEIEHNHSSPQKQTPVQKRYSHPEDLPRPTNHTNNPSISHKTPNSIPKQIFDHDKIVTVRSDEEADDSDEPIEAKIDLSAYLTGGSSHNYEEGHHSSGKKGKRDEDIKGKTFNKYHNDSLKYMQEAGSLVENQPYYDQRSNGHHQPTNPHIKKNSNYSQLEEVNYPQKGGSATERAHDREKSRNDPFDNFEYQEQRKYSNNYIQDPRDEEEDDAMLEDIRTKLKVLNQKVDVNSLRKPKPQEDEVNYGSAKTPKTRSHFEQNANGNYQNKPGVLQRDRNEYDEDLLYFNNGRRNHEKPLTHHIPMTSSEYVNVGDKFDPRADNLAIDVNGDYGQQAKSAKKLTSSHY